MNRPQVRQRQHRESADLKAHFTGTRAPPVRADRVPWPDAIVGQRCPVCESSMIRLFASVEGRDYLRCRDCEATFLHPEQRPSPECELAEYRLHRNHVDDPAYRAFLRPVADLLNARLPPASRGLDYGCGPAPALASMLRESGHRVALYDPFFLADASAFDCRYDFIACTETVEHFHEPFREFRRLAALLNPGGWIVIQTSFQAGDAAFARWNYRRDPTHVVFYRQSTFRRIASDHAWTAEFPAPNLALFLSRPA